MQAKLDELIRAVNDARNEFIGIEHRTDREIEAIRAALEREVGDSVPDDEHPATSVERLRDRF
jgi:low affinity Fe/Cu permease